MCMDWFKDLFIDEVKPIVDKWNSAGGSGGSGGSGPSGKIPTKLSDLENDLFYIRKETVVDLTQDDFETWVDPDGNSNTIYIGSPALGVRAVGEFPNTTCDLGYELSFTFNGSRYTYTSDEYGWDKCNNDIMEDGNECSCFDAKLFAIYDRQDFKNWDRWMYKDEFAIVLGSLPPADSLTLKVFREVSKKIPIEYCDTSEIEAEIANLTEEVNNL